MLLSHFGGAHEMSKILNDLRSVFPAGVLRGREFQIGNIYGDKGDSLRINVDNELWCDFADPDCKGKGLMSLYYHMRKAGVPFAPGGDRQALPPPPPHKSPARQAIDDAFKPEYPGRTADAKDMLIGLPLPLRHKMPNVAYPYVDIDGRLCFYTRLYRPDPDNPKKKEVIPLSWRDGKWVGKMWPCGLPPFDIRRAFSVSQLPANAHKPIVIVEGEPCATALNRALMNWPVISWAGGTNAVYKTDWAQLLKHPQRRVVIWPDNDDVGVKAAYTIHDILKPLGFSVEILQPDSAWPEGYDCKDHIEAGAQAPNLIRLIEDGRRIIMPRTKEDLEALPGPEPVRHSGLSEAALTNDEVPFLCLGVKDLNVYIFCKRTKQILRFFGAPKNDDMLFIAPYEYWEQNFPGRGGPNWRLAKDMILRQCSAAGIYQPENQRGRGAWLDAGRLVYHLGDVLLNNSEAINIPWRDTQHQYQIAQRLPAPAVHQENFGAARALLAICKQLSWRSPEFASYLAGWILLAPICGALPWRPHIWITADRGSGKSYIMDNLIKRALGPYALSATGETTEAGIRQTLNCDALPVVIDETEADDEASNFHVQKIVKFARVASVDSESMIIKGGQYHTSKSFRPRSMFCFSSIVSSLQKAQDMSRFCVLEMGAPLKGQAWKELLEMLDALPEDWSRQLLGYALRMHPVIMHNFKVIQSHIHSLKEARFGDQIGMLLAGASVCYGTQPISVHQVRQYLDAFNLEAMYLEAGIVHDPSRLHQQIMGIEIPINTAKFRSTMTVQVALLHLTNIETMSGEVDSRAMLMALVQHGIALSNDRREIFILKGHEKLRQCLEKQKKFYGDYARILARGDIWKYNIDFISVGGISAPYVSARARDFLKPILEVQDHRSKRYTSPLLLQSADDTPPDDF